MIHPTHPLLLLAAPAAVAFLFIAARRAKSDLPAIRRAASLILRTMIALALILAMVGLTATHAASQPPCIIFVVDVSESIDDAALEQAARHVESAAARIAASGGWTGMVAFAGRPQTLRAPQQGPLLMTGDLYEHVLWRRSESTLRAAVEHGDPGAEVRLATFTTWRESLDVLSTRTAPAVLAAQALFRPDAQNHIVVLTDGRETRDARPPGDGHVTWVRLPSSQRSDLIVTALSAPPAVRHGEPFDVDVEVEASHPGEVAFALTVDDLVQTTTVERFRLGAPGRYTLTLNAPEAMRNLPPGLHRLMVIASQEGETEKRNNQAFAGVAIVGPPEVLLIEGAPLEGETLARVLKVQQIGLKRVPAENLSGHTDGLDRYAAVALAGTAPSALRTADIAALREYVENGGGLLFVGTSRWTDAGFDQPEFAPMLPVEWTAPPKAAGADPDPSRPKPPPRAGTSDPKRVLAPTVALLLLIDKSGSMAGRNIELAREACIAASETLSEHDSVGVLAFDVKPRWIVEWTRVDSHDYIQRQLLRLQADGGTNIFPGLVEAHRSFRSDPRAGAAGVKHVILLSDGITPPANFEEQLRRMAQDSVTVTSVCVGSAEFDAMLMKQIANLGHGRFLFTGDFRNVPKIFTNEAKFIIKESARAAEAKMPPVEPPPAETEPTPAPPTANRRRVAVRLRDPHEVLKGIEGELPVLQGLLGAKPRPTAYVPLASGDDEPVLALWRYGLGKTAAWTSDLGGPWSQPWTAWNGTPRLFAQLVRHLSSAVEDGGLGSRVSVSREGDRVALRVDAGPAPEELELHLLAPRRERIDFGPLVDGARTASLTLETPGTLHLLSVVARGEREQRFPLAVALPYSMELASPALDRPFQGLAAAPRSLADLSEILPPVPVQRDSRTDLAPWCLLAAVLLLPLDVAVRRVR